jgi:RNA polymerase sigma-70 factor, ECF subfamily
LESDAALVECCLAGDPLGMRALVERFQSVVFALCYRMLSHREDAEDVAQDVFVRAFRSLHCWDSSRPLKPWLLAIAANRCRTALEKRSRKPVTSDFVTYAAEAAPASTGELAEELQIALETLREEYRTCFILFHQQELSCAEVAGIMNCPEGTVKTWLYRARRELAEHLIRRGVAPHAHHELH